MDIIPNIIKFPRTLAICDFLLFCSRTGYRSKSQSDGHAMTQSKICRVADSRKRREPDPEFHKKDEARAVCGYNPAFAQPCACWIETPAHRKPSFSSSIS